VARQALGLEEQMVGRPEGQVEQQLFVVILERVLRQVGGQLVQQWRTWQLDFQEPRALGIALLATMGSELSDGRQGGFNGKHSEG